MARVQYGAIVTEIKGKIQGHVFQGGNVGFVLRNKGYTPGNSNALRFKASSRLGSISSAWKGLTDVERAAWNALSPTWLFTNKFGASYEGSGFQIFQAYNNPLVLAEFDIVTTPSVPAVPTDPGLMTFSTHTTASLKFNLVGLALTNNAFYLYASPPLSAGVTGSRIRYTLMDVYDYSIPGPFNFRTQYLNKYGTYQAGSRIFIRSIARNTDYPYPYYEQFANAIIT